VKEVFSMSMLSAHRRHLFVAFLAGASFVAMAACGDDPATTENPAQPSAGTSAGGTAGTSPGGKAGVGGGSGTSGSGGASGATAGNAGNGASGQAGQGGAQGGNAGQSSAGAGGVGLIGSGGDAGSGPPPLTDDCAICAQTICDAESSSCLSNPTCRALTQCLVDCGPVDPSCQIKCGLGQPDFQKMAATAKPCLRDADRCALACAADAAPAGACVSATNTCIPGVASSLPAWSCCGDFQCLLAPRDDDTRPNQHRCIHTLGGSCDGQAKDPDAQCQAPETSCDRDTNTCAVRTCWKTGETCGDTPTACCDPRLVCQVPQSPTPPAEAQPTCCAPSGTIVDQAESSLCCSIATIGRDGVIRCL
jgi:hypothetical protein